VGYVSAMPGNTGTGACDRTGRRRRGNEPSAYLTSINQLILASMIRGLTTNASG
jgi:hypothetical protein